MIWMATAWASIVINEVLPDPAGPDVGQEWIELVNTGPQARSLTAWQLQTATSSWTTRHTFGDVVLLPGTFLVVGDAPGVDVSTGPLGLGNAGSSGDGVRLLDAGGVVVDTLVYGPDGGGLHDDGGPARPVPSPGTGLSLARAVDGGDTDDPGDWIEAPPSAGNPNEPVCTGAGQVLISELVPDPEGPDAGREWIELVNTGPAADLTGWSLDTGGTTWSRSSRLPEGTEIPAGGRLVLAASPAVQADALLPDLRLGNGSGGDAVQVRDCRDLVADGIVYGASNDDGWPLPDEGLAPAPQSGLSLGRLETGGSWLLLDPTPGDPNRLVPLPCDAAYPSLVVNEIQPAGDPDWVELLHTGAVPLAADGWRLQVRSDADWRDRHRFDGVIEPGERLVLPIGDLPFDASLRLVDCTDTAVDLVDYALEPGLVAQRQPDGHDTDRASDLVRSTQPDPGEPNAPSVCTTGWLLAELLPDPEGADEGQEYVELVGEAEASLDGWVLRIDDEPLFLSGSAPNGRVLVDGFSLPNGRQRVTRIELLDCGGTVVDVLPYGPADLGGVVQPVEGLSIEASANGWQVALPSPGEPPVTVHPTRGGCQTSGRSTATPLLLLAGLLRRRRDTGRPHEEARWRFWTSSPHRIPSWRWPPERSGPTSSVRISSSTSATCPRPCTPLRASVSPVPRSATPAGSS